MTYAVRVRTVGEAKRALADLPDDMPFLFEEVHGWSEVTGTPTGQYLPLTFWQRRLTQGAEETLVVMT